MVDLIQHPRFPLKQMLGLLQQGRIRDLGYEFLEDAQFIKAIAVLRQVGMAKAPPTQFPDEVVASPQQSGLSPHRAYGHGNSFLITGSRAVPHLVSEIG